MNYSAYAIGSLVVSIISVFLLDKVALYVAFLGILLGVIAISELKKSEKKGFWLAIAGIVIGVVVVIALIAIMASHASAAESAKENFLDCETNQGICMPATDDPERTCEQMTKFFGPFKCSEGEICCI